MRPFVARERFHVVGLLTCDSKPLRVEREVFAVSPKHAGRRAKDRWTEEHPFDQGVVILTVTRRRLRGRCAA